jgi:hypothetical protein
MRGYTRIIFGLNALYQLAVGVIFLFAPVTAIGLYGFPASEGGSVATLVSLRALGAYVLLGAGLSAIIGVNPDRHPVLLPVMGALAVLTLVAWGVTLAAGEMTIAQVGLDAAVQGLLLVAVVGYAARARQAR